MLFDARTRAFRVFGGSPMRDIFDNMKTTVDKVKLGKESIVNERFTVLTAYYLFDTDFCNVASGWEKGIVEKNVQDSRRRIWQEAGKPLSRFMGGTDLPEAMGLTLQEALVMEQPIYGLFVYCKINFHN